MRIVNGKVHYPTHRCRECQLMVMHEPNDTCDVCLSYGAAPAPLKPFNPYGWLTDWTYAP